MKTTKKTWMAAVVAAGVGLAGVSFAGGMGHGFKARFDTDGDGQLSETERAAMREAKQKHRAEMLQKFDSNRDGKLDDAERQVARKEKATERFRTLDKNNDGMLSLDEFQAGHAERMGKRGPRGMR